MNASNEPKGGTGFSSSDFSSHEGSVTLNPAEEGVAVVSPGEEGRLATAGGSYSPEVRARLEQDAKEIISRYPRTRSALLPLLHLVQSEDGYVSDAGQEFCAEMLGLTKAEVVGVSTFYTMYKRRPMGDYHVGVCVNTLCAIMGGDQIWDELSEHVGVGHDEATPDGRISLERLECNAACDFAPVMMVNWEFFDNQTPASAKQLVDDLRAGKDVSPTRGPKKLCTFKEASRVLAGLPDDLAGDGPSAAGASLEGLKIAQANGWKAPEA
ncbi:NADH-quinone oxidoreductase subunit E [Planobispora rosea]|uniref:NADH-quinone oxidoreductase subunit E n=1 Tax=Planobispora rosea TaxID=35762 RepID=A0A8J3WBT2_PLARO|nr:NADH-quinone oxidoreductase subunit NuoE [Planobispora rosea]GGS82584.1 NADH-quinone oxidoreductase subunit E [Planobispora rosea]GIH84229.1 NADH-quinone oxidoreductase subunit E [Planobispora rosea]